MIVCERVNRRFQPIQLMKSAVLPAALWLLVWVVGYFIPSRNDQAKKELRSNIDVMGLCLNLK